MRSARPALTIAVAAIVLAGVGLVPAAAQMPQHNTDATGPSRAGPSVLTPAPVPSISPASPSTGVPSAIPEQIARPGAGATDAGPANATPFSGAPSGTLGPDAALPTNRDGVGASPSGAPPNVSR